MLDIFIPDEYEPSSLSKKKKKSNRLEDKDATDSIIL